MMLRWRGGRASCCWLAFFLFSGAMMKRFFLVLIFATAARSFGGVPAASQTAVSSADAARIAAPARESADTARWEREAARVMITRDDWGIAHVHGKTDEDAVFGMIYAQAEDDFNRIETNYLDAMGRRAEAEGESAIFRDLRMRLFIDPQDLQALY